MWDDNKKGYLQRINKIKSYLKNNKFIDANDVVEVLSQLIHSGDRVCIEGDNQKQASYLASALAKLNPKLINNLHMIQSAIVLPEHLNIFDKGVLDANPRNFRTNFNHVFLFYSMQENFVYYCIKINDFITRKNEVPLKMDVLPSHRRNFLQHS